MNENRCEWVSKELFIFTWGEALRNDPNKGYEGD